MTPNKCTPTCKIWLEHEGEPVVGKGGADILEAIKEEKSISKAARTLGMSYRYVWNYLERMKRVLGEPIIETSKGGKTGGGANLRPLGESLLKEYRRIENYVGKLLVDEEHWEMISLKISARNRLEGTVKEVEKDGIVAKVKVQIETPVIVTAVISKEAVEELNIQAGDHVKAIIKATEVMIAKNNSS